VWRTLLAMAGVLLLLVGAVVIAGCVGFGGRARGERKARMERSPQFRDGHFVNPQPLENSARGMIAGAFQASAAGKPAQPLPVVPGDGRRFETPPASGLRATWLGHSTVLVEVDGHRVLTDPVWGERASPIGWLGPRRWYAPPIPLDQLPPVDAVVISHDHYDHLDQPTISAMKSWPTKFVVPLGLGAHLVRWGVPEARIIELDWWERAQVGGLTIVCTPARHASGRMLIDNDAKLWAGFALLGPVHRVYFSGDTGLFPAVREIGTRLGPFDLTMIEIGQYHRAWPDWHIGPEQALTAHRWVRGRVMLPIHWGLFRLAYHGWTEPIERVLASAAVAGATVVAPRPGQSFEPIAPPPVERWWPSVPWRTGAQEPIVSTKLD
jgi:L-ascorbate metabolism protein UlaG (beta-lactamase superfamily)